MKRSFLLIVSLFLLSFAGFSQQFNFKNDNISLQFTEFKVIGEQVHCKFLITAIGNDETFSIQMSKVKMFDTEGNEYISTKGKIGIKDIGPHAMRADLIAGIPVKGRFIFFGAISKRNKITMFEIPVNLVKQGLDFNIRMKDIMIPFGASASNKELQNNKNYKEIDDNSFIELKTTTKKENTLTFDFIVTNLGDDKNQTLLSGKCKFFDESGNEYIINHTFFGNSKGSVHGLVRKQCVKEIPVKLSLIFTDEKIANIKEIKLLELSMNDNKFQFRNITP